MAESVERWVEVNPSQYRGEAEGLEIVRSLLPAEAPFRAWSNFEFRDGQGKWYEVDLLLLGRRRLHLVELKHYCGVLRGDDLTWLRDEQRAEDSPLKLARRKAQRLASKLRDEIRSVEKGADEATLRSAVPFVHASVFLHHPAIRSQLPEKSRIDLFSLDGRESTTGLPGISQRLLEPATDKQSVGLNGEAIIAALMARIGAVQHIQREAGSWALDKQALADGDGWQDWLASHRVTKEKRARIRFLVTAPGAPLADRVKLRRIAEHEYQIMSRLANDHLLRPLDVIENKRNVCLVYPYDDRFQRLDLWLADQADQASDADRLSVLQQVAEAVAYAHGNRVVHRGLTPHAVFVRPMTDGGVLVQVGGWQSAGAVPGAQLTGLPSKGVTSLFEGSDGGGQPPGPPGTTGPSATADADRQFAEAFQAPEGVYKPGGDRIRLDVFALGALAYFLMSGGPAASGRAALRERLNRDGALDLAADWPDAPPAVRALVLESTRSAVTERLPDVGSFLEQLALAERALISPADDAADPLEASPGSIIDGRFQLERRLGAGSTAVGLLVTDLTITRSSLGNVRVLKIAISDAAAARLSDEAEVLAGLSSRRIVRLLEGPVEVGGRRALVLESAGNETLAEVLHRSKQPPRDRLERWGADLLEAVVALDHGGVNHRDIKPANLGVREDDEDHTQHLVLFDFSMSRARASAVTAGTPPYLDPYLDDPGRGRFDSAAERYSAAVVLFEMAAGAAPQFGDGMSDPGCVPDEAALKAPMFDTAVADALVAFFRTALARDAQERHKSAEDMLADWRAVFAPATKTTIGNASEPVVQPGAPTTAPPRTPLPAAEAPPDSAARLPGAAAAHGDTAITAPDADDGQCTVLEPARAKGAAEDPRAERGPGSRGPGAKRSRARSRWVMAALAAALVVLGTAGWVRLARSQHSPPASRPAAEASYVFASRQYRDGLLVARRWTLSGKNGSRLTETVTANSATGHALRVRFKEAIPAAIAPTLRTVHFTPAPVKIIRADPVVAWNLRVPAQGIITVGYQARVPATGAVRTRLLRWARDLNRMEARLDLAKGKQVRSRHPSGGTTASPSPLPSSASGPVPSTVTPTPTTTKPTRSSSPTPARSTRPPSSVPIPIGEACLWAYPGQASGDWSGSGYGIECLDASGQSLGGFPDNSGHSLNDWCADPSHTDGNPTLIQAKLTPSGSWICTTVQ